MPFPRHLGRTGRLFAFGLSLVFLVAHSQFACALTGTFIDRQLPTDLRVVSYNIYQTSIFSDINPTQAAKFQRVVQAVNADIWNLQEIYDKTAAQTVTLMNSIAPLPGGATWYAHQSFDNVIVSKYPLTMLATDTIPEPTSTSVALALVNLPDAQFETDFYFMNNHFKCCGAVGSSEDQKRQQQADALVNWMRDARGSYRTDYIDLPDNTPMAVAGDLNLVGSLQPLTTLVTGDIINTGTYGADSPPDWDGSSLTDAHPYHNVTGTDDYTWRDDPSGYPRGRLDYMIYTDSVVDVAHKFILNTVAMSAAERTATGLQQYDVMLNSSDWDHLPVVVDFRFPSDDVLGDYDDSGYVDMDDFDYWKNAYGTADPAADGNLDGRVNAADFTIWRDNLGAGDPPGMGAATSVPEPTALLLALGLISLLVPTARMRRRPSL